MTQPPLPIQPDLIERLDQAIRALDENPADTIGAPGVLHEIKPAILTLQAQRDELREALEEARSYVVAFVEDYGGKKPRKLVTKIDALAAPQGGVS